MTAIEEIRKAARENGWRNSQSETEWVMSCVRVVSEEFGDEVAKDILTDNDTLRISKCPACILGKWDFELGCQCPLCNDLRH